MATRVKVEFTVPAEARKAAEADPTGREDAEGACYFVAPRLNQNRVQPCRPNAAASP